MKQVAATLLIGAVFAATVYAQPPTSAQRTEKRLLDCTLESASVSDCDFVTYAQRVLTYCVPGFFWGILTLLMCPLYCGGKYCCNCCGGRNQSPGCVCPTNNVPMVYSRFDIIRVKFWALFCVVFAVAAFIWGYAGGAQLLGGVQDFGDAITAIPDVLTAEITAIDDALVLNSFNSTTNGTTPERLFSTTGNATKAEAENARDELKKQIEDSLGDYQGYVDQGKDALWFAFLIPLCIIGVGAFLGIFCSCRKFVPMILVWLLFLFSVLIWVCNGVFGAALFIFTDMCVELDGIANQQANILASVAGCKDSQFTSFRSSFRSLEITQAESVCNDMLTRCYNTANTITTNIGNGRVYDCSGWEGGNPTCSGKTFADLVDVVESVYKIHPIIMADTTTPNIGDYRCADTSTDCTLARCAVDCTAANGGGYLNEMGLPSLQILTTFQGAQQISNVIDTLGAKYANCDSAMKIVLGGLSTPCARLRDGLGNEMNATGLLAFSMTLSIFVFAWGAKRFINVGEGGVEQMENCDQKDSSAPPA